MKGQTRIQTRDPWMLSIQSTTNWDIWRDNISVIWLNNHSHSFLFNNKLLNIYRHIAIKNNFIIYQELLTIMVASHRICSFHIRWNSFWNLFPYLSHVTLIPSSMSFTLNPSLKILKNRLHFQMYDVENFFTINDKTIKSQCSFNKLIRVVCLPI